EDVEDVAPRASPAARLTTPGPRLADDRTRLEPLAQRHVPGLPAAVEGDAEIVRYARVPAGADRAFVSSWIRRYEERWQDGSGAGFAITDHDGDVLGFAAIVPLDLPGREAELGYLVARSARRQDGAYNG